VCILRPVGPKQSGKAGWGLLVGADRPAAAVVGVSRIQKLKKCNG